MFIAISQPSSVFSTNRLELHMYPVCQHISLWGALLSSDHYVEAPVFSLAFLSRTISGWSSPETVDTQCQVLSLVITSSLTSSVSWAVLGVWSLESPPCLVLIKSQLPLLHPPPQVHENSPQSLPSLLHTPRVICKPWRVPRALPPSRVVSHVN